ncbi:hypothetical protein PHJA_002586600 [Phtheirospermum japonicum]|uniref:Uncharacterized protein n=1 Tax=Phtheirospermum japonicum TaxID=374723 RepID=A0A830CYS5_9LAMI|nr:hypothetical protein PHJA_002586600 [Phtheirospermum japonicum]
MVDIDSPTNGHCRRLNGEKPQLTHWRMASALLEKSHHEPACWKISVAIARSEKMGEFGFGDILGRK